MTEKIRTTIEIDRRLWARVHQKAVAQGKSISEALEQILREYFQMAGSAMLQQWTLA